ncbi:hypothetical protein AB0M68_32795 [Streptomyces sp. NPDC051453]
MERNHTIVPAHDPQTSAQFLAAWMKLGSPPAFFWRTSMLC